jgi:hypothetical protein
MMIRDPPGETRSFGTNTFHQRVSCGRVKAGARLRARFEFPDMALGVGSYSLTVALHTRETHLLANFDWWDRSLVVPGDPLRPPAIERCMQPSVVAQWLPAEERGIEEWWDMGDTAAGMMKRIRARLVAHRPKRRCPRRPMRRRAGLLDDDFTQAQTAALPAFRSSPRFRHSPDGRYRLSDLLGYYDDTFIRAAYPGRAQARTGCGGLPSAPARFAGGRLEGRDPQGASANARGTGRGRRHRGIARASHPRWPGAMAAVGRFVRTAIAVW